MSDEKWSDWRSWWMDLLKWSLTFCVGFGLSFLIIDRLDQKRSEERALCTATVTRLQRTAETFEQASFAYIRAAELAFIELYRWRDEQPTEPIQRYWGPAYSDFLASLTGVQRRFGAFPSIENHVEDLKEQADGAFKIIDPLIDRRLDRIASFYQRSSDMSTDQGNSQLDAAMRPVPTEVLRRARRHYEAELEKAREARGRLMEAIEQILDSPASELCGELAKRKS